MLQLGFQSLGRESRSRSNSLALPPNTATAARRGSHPKGSRCAAASRAASTSPSQAWIANRAAHSRPSFGQSLTRLSNTVARLRATTAIVCWGNQRGRFVETLEASQFAAKFGSGLVGLAAISKEAGPSTQHLQILWL